MRVIDTANDSSALITGLDSNGPPPTLLQLAGDTKEGGSAAFWRDGQVR